MTQGIVGIFLYNRVVDILTPETQKGKRILIEISL